jgi:hypothetical protein
MRRRPVARVAVAAAGVRVTAKLEAPPHTAAAAQSRHRPCLTGHTRYMPQAGPVTLAVPSVGQRQQSSGVHLMPVIWSYGLGAEPAA